MEVSGEHPRWLLPHCLCGLAPSSYLLWRITCPCLSPHLDGRSPEEQGLCLVPFHTLGSHGASPVPQHPIHRPLLIVGTKKYLVLDKNIWLHEIGYALQVASPI